MKNLIEMSHPKSKVNIFVQRGQVSNAEYRGWKIVKDKAASDSKQPSEVNENGKGSRK